MPHSSNTIQFAELLVSLAQEIPLQQARLDADFLARFESFAPLLLAAKKEGCEDLVRTIAPLMMTFNEVEIKTAFHLARSREKQFALSLRLLNLGYNRRYAYADFTHSHLEIKVQRNPLSPENSSARKTLD